MRAARIGRLAVQFTLGSADERIVNWVRIRRRTRGPDVAAGFTLIELLVVIIIIGILAAIAIPVFLAQRNKAYDAQVRSTMHNALLAESTYFVDNHRFSQDAATMSGVDASTTWHGSNGGDDTGLPDAGVVYFEQAQGGQRQHDRVRRSQQEWPLLLRA